jgi:hypothetical protein
MYALITPSWTYTFDEGWRSRSPLNPIDLPSQIDDVRNVPLIWPIG